MKVAVFSAFPHELSGTIRRLGMKKTFSGHPLLVYSARSGEHDVVAVRTGMGRANLSSAFNFVCKEFQPECVVSAGFGGALYPGASAGDLVLASRIFILPEHQGEVPGFDQWKECAVDSLKSEEIQKRVSSQILVKKGTVITLRNWTPKEGIRRALPQDFGTAVCDMESYFLGKLSEGNGLHFLAIRSISDCADEDVPRALLDVSDGSGVYSLVRSLRIIVTKPRLLPSVISLGINSRIASQNLGSFISSLMAII